MCALLLAEQLGALWRSEQLGALWRSEEFPYSPANCWRGGQHYHAHPHSPMYHTYHPHTCVQQVAFLRQEFVGLDAKALPAD